MTYLDLVDIPVLREQEQGTENRNYFTLKSKTIIASSPKAISTFSRNKRKKQANLIFFLRIYWTLKLLITKQQRLLKSLG